MTIGMDLVSIRVGHNVIGLSQAAVGGPARVRPLQKAARVTMANLSHP
jgi:hypothetical protein